MPPSPIMTQLHEPLKFAYWVPNVSGGLVTSDIEQRTDWGYEYNRDLAVIAENNGFEYALTQVRYTAEYKRRGASLLLLGFLHFQEEIEYFGRHVLPIIRELEKDLDRGAATPEPVGSRA